MNFNKIINNDKINKGVQKLRRNNNKFNKEVQKLGQNNKINKKIQKLENKFKNKFNYLEEVQELNPYPKKII